ncbi:uncharacterized protein [Chironomus tepperi]|uniref:uncharacterized protein n=1 Tax=Chironomus tepperi TaxID=113505 RepID=UPI00391F7459
MTDPLLLFSKVTCEEIFSYLSVKELLNCSLLNKSYYDFIAKTPSFMKRIKIRLHIHHNLVLEDYKLLKILNESTRRYQRFESINLTIDFFNAYIKLPNLKSIKIRGIGLLSECELVPFNTGINVNIEELILERFNGNLLLKVNSHRLSCHNFPTLRRLELHYVPPFIFRYYSDCSNLTELKVTGKRDEHFYNLLRLNTQLKKLTIVTDAIDNYFDEDLTKFIQFKLTYFEARDIYNLTVNCIENFKLFIQKQMNTLEEINLGDWIAANIVRMIFHMPRLKKLTFKGFHNVEEHVRMNEMDFHRSQTITTLHLIDTFSRADILHAFTVACPKVIHLKLYALQKDALLYLTQTIPNLQTLSVDLLEIKEFSNDCDFAHLKDFKMKVYNRDLQFSEAINNNFENLVKKEIERIENMNNAQ